MPKPMIAVYDKKTALFDAPFSCRHKNEAIREWHIVASDRNTKFGKNPEDFDLYEIGTFNEETGELITHKPAIQIASGVQ